MELGVVLMNCPCLAEDMRRIFASYWALTRLLNASNDVERSVESERVQLPMAEYNAENPLRILHQGEKTDIFLAVSSGNREYSQRCVAHEIHNECVTHASA